MDNMYGNYCGPYWSDGKIQPSVVGLTPPTNELDHLCQQHDAAYARGMDRKDADMDFSSRAWKHGVAGLFMAGAVGLQGLLRRDGVINMTKKQGNLRGAQPQPKKATQQNAQSERKRTPSRGMDLSVPPVSIGTTFRATAPKITRSTDSAHLVGHDFIGAVEGTGVTVFGVGKIAALHPAYFSSSMLGTMCKSFERFTWRSLRIHYVPRVASTAVGQVILTSLKSPSMPQLQGESGTFLQRALTQGNAVFAPLWTPTYIDIDCDGEWRLVNPATTSDIDDTVPEELGVFTQVATSGQVGYLWAEYSIDFKGALYQPQSTLIPVPTGPGLRVTLQDVAAINAANDDVLVADVGDVLSISTTGGGAIYRFILDYPTMSPGTGATAANMWHVAVRSVTTTTGSAVQATTWAVPAVGGLALYLKCINVGVIQVFTSLEAAVAGSGSGQLFYRTATTTASSFAGDAYLVRIGESNLVRSA